MKRIFFTLASCFLAYQSFILLSNLDQLRFESLLGNIFLAWVLNIFVTGVFAFLVFAWPASRLVPEVYYTIHKPTFFHRFFAGIGGEYFRAFLLKTIWKNKNRQKVFFNGKKEGLLDLDFQSRQSEWGHLLPFVILLVTSILLFIKELYVLGAWVAVFNIIGNFYPVLLQRHHRMRIARLLRMKRVG